MLTLRITLYDKKGDMHPKNTLHSSFVVHYVFRLCAHVFTFEFSNVRGRVNFEIMGESKESEFLMQGSLGHFSER